MQNKAPLCLQSQIGSGKLRLRVLRVVLRCGGIDETLKSAVLSK